MLGTKGGIRARLRLLLAGALSALTGGCSFVPTTGPTVRQIDSQEGPASFIVVDLNHGIVRELAAASNVGLSRRLLPSQISTKSRRIGAGDVLAVTIWEAGEGGLFSSQSSKSVSFPGVVVEPSGEISLPYAGVINVSGRQTLEVQKQIVASLSDRAIQPQAVVNIVENRTNTAVLNGDVVKPGLYPLSAQGERLLDVIAAAGGTKGPARETTVMVLRKDQRAEQLLNAIIADPEENILIAAGDRIFLNHEPRRYTVVGAVNRSGVYPFETLQVNVLEAIAAAGGLIDERADATGVFVFRYERADLLRNFVTAVPEHFGDLVPVAYRLNLKNAESYFFAKGFTLRDKDVVFAANAEGFELSKVLRLVNMATSAAGVGRHWDLR
jgi:polysaccharide export outer membrane protein